MAPQSVAANSWAAARTQLVPPGATAVLICRYAGLNAHPRFALVGEAQVRVRVLTNELTREFDELPAWKPTIMIVCPDDRGTQITAQFSYPRGRAVTVASATSGCFNVSNGDISRAGGEFGRPVGPKLLKQLQSLSN
jgi:hypothetical protein